MNWSNYIPLLIIFVVIFNSVTKKKQVEKMKTNLPSNRNEKEIYSTEKVTIKKAQEKKNTMQAKVSKIVEPKTFHTNDTICIETDELNDNFSILKIDEIRRAIVYAEIFNREFYNN